MKPKSQRRGRSYDCATVALQVATGGTSGTGFRIRGSTGGMWLTKAPSEQKDRVSLFDPCFSSQPEESSDVGIWMQGDAGVFPAKNERELER